MIENPTGMAIFWPMIAHVIIVYVVYFLMSARRIRAVQDGRVDVKNYKMNRYGDEPEEAFITRANIANQFELPVLFHIVCLGLYVTGAAGLLAVTVACLFVLARVAHAAVHLTVNRVVMRRRAFIGSFIATGLLWLLLALRLMGLETY
ncbi:MAPEG family protein [Notoacmeibacter sp. MSK16QG-6]|uniref:MAPEG family protein n=1 Tax=Notoacmeibacter sp. MSK16QG-6 TaxID=2957982 RepID=UPI0020A1D704|nr:MAPEG family protein [Notoacmeibacter sp. MSK16QG-6]MCP1198407.1 MAPEG family protein [Notoacmeibacter sp. MSK16QG-6]